jgi:hypothetical protein
MTGSTEPDSIILWNYCLQCKRVTMQEIAESIDNVDDPEQSPLATLEKFQILCCRGCGAYSFRYGWRFEDEYDRPWSWTNYPERSNKRKTPLNTYLLPHSVMTLYVETLRAFNSDAPTLASAGLRATVEAICIEQGFTKGDLKTKIDNLCAAGVLPKTNDEYLHQHRFVGNDAVHDMQAAPEDEFEIALEILEHLLKSLYELPRRAKELVRLRAERGAKVQ